MKVVWTVRFSLVYSKSPLKLTTKKNATMINTTKILFTMSHTSIKKIRMYLTLP